MSVVGIIKWIVISLLFVFWVGEDEQIEIENSIHEGEFDMEDKIVAQGVLDAQAEAVYQVYADGDLALANSLGEFALTGKQAYALLDVLYQYQHVLRQLPDVAPTQPLDLPF